MKAGKFLIPVFLSVLGIFSLCAVNIQSVKSQPSPNYIYIQSDGNIRTSDNVAVPIQRVGDLYTFNGNISSHSVVVQRSNIVVDGAGFTLQGTYWDTIGIDLSSRSNVTVRNLTIIGYDIYGIYLSKSSNNLIVENDLIADDIGIRILEHSNNNIISTNNITNCHNSGIAIEDASNNNIISANNITNCVNGIGIIASSNNELRNNRMNNMYNFGVYGTELAHFFNEVDDSNTVNGRLVYYLVNQSDVVINSYTFPDLGFLALVNCINMTAQNLKLTLNGQGALLAFTTNSSITSNTITKNYNGLELYSSSTIMIFGNNITNNNNGIQLGGSSRGNRLYTNNIKNNINGVGLIRSSGNTIYNNYFISNRNQVYDAHMGDTTITNSVNDWNLGYPKGGNYWNDYTGVDVKSGAGQDQPGDDGIGDTPYVIYENNQDNYPLLPYGSPPAIHVVSPENKTYTATEVSLIFFLSEPTPWIGYSLDGQANVTIIGNTTLSGLSYGLHSVTVHATDNDGMTGTSETIYFTAAQEQPQPFPLILIVSAAVIVLCVAAVVLGLVTYIRRKRKTTNN